MVIGAAAPAAPPPAVEPDVPVVGPLDEERWCPVPAADLEDLRVPIRLTLVVALDDQPVAHARPHDGLLGSFLGRVAVRK